MMEEQVCFDNYPLRIVVLSNILLISIYITGIYLVSGVGLIWALLFFIYIVLLEIRLLGRHCTDCFYYGKTCAFGKGRLSSCIFSKGNPERFCSKKITGKDMIPDLAVVLIPVLAGIYSLISGYDWITLLLIIVLLILGFPGNAYVRGKLACIHCRQKETGCPAADFFDK